MTDASDLGLVAPERRASASSLGLSPPQEKSIQEGPSVGERFITGVADPGVGLGQAAAHLGVVTPSGGMPEFGVFTPDSLDPLVKTEDIDQAVKKRELDYQARRKASGQTGIDWARGAGNILSDIALTAPLGYLGAGAAPVTMAGRIGTAMLASGEAGALSGAAQPVTGNHYGEEKTGQIIGSSLGGAAIGGPLGVATSAILGKSPEVAEQFVRNAYRRFVKPTTAGINESSDVSEHYDQARSAIDSIINNKANLSMVDEFGRTSKGRLPQSLDEFGQAIEQTKKKIFEQYDSLAKEAGTKQSEEPLEAHFGNLFRSTSKEVGDAEKELSSARNALTMATAKQSRAGENVYLSAAANSERRAADARVQAALDRLAKAKMGHASATEKLYSVAVDLHPVAKELLSLSNKKEVADLHPDLLKYALGRAKAMMNRGVYSPIEAQDAVANLNRVLKSFYQNPTMQTAERASVDAMIANKLREGLDKVIEKATGKEYQPLKNEYGALKAIEKNVVNRSMVSGRQNPGGGLIGLMGDIASVDELSRAIMHLNLPAAGTAAGIKLGQATLRYLRDPNRAIKRMFETAEQMRQPQTTTQKIGGAVQPYMAPTGGAVVGDLVRALGL